MMKVFLFVRNYWLSLTWATIVLVLTLIPGKAIPDVPVFGIDKTVHFFLFGLLMFLMLIESHRQKVFRNTGGYFILLAYTLCISYGIFIELIQNFIPGRSSSVYDAIANSIGVCIGHVIFLLISKKYFTKA